MLSFLTACVSKKPLRIHKILQVLFLGTETLKLKGNFHFIFHVSTAQQKCNESHVSEPHKFKISSRHILRSKKETDGINFNSIYF